MLKQTNYVLKGTGIFGILLKSQEKIQIQIRFLEMYFPNYFVQLPIFSVSY